SKAIERIKEKSSKNKVDLISRIDEDSLRLYTARKQLSHEKIYILQANDGRKRVVTGSANMSHSAFSGMQRENICYMDGDRAFDWYYGCFEELRDNSTDNITVKMITVDDTSENIEELPIAQTVKVQKALIIEPQINEQFQEDKRFALSVKGLAAKYAPLMPKSDKKGKTLITPDAIKLARRKLDDVSRQEKELRNEYPQLVIDIENSAVILNDRTLDLNPQQNEIENDVRLFLEYMNGYEKFHGDVQLMQTRYFEFANWFFATPFFATMRNMAALNNQVSFPYPVFGLVYGKSKAGKTSFLETLLKMMIGQKTKIAAPDFTRSSIEGLRREVKGAPIIVDDLTQARFSQHAVETIKNDDFGVLDRLSTYPAVVISANEDVKAVAPEIVRRTVICRVEAGLKNTDIIRSSNVVRKVQQQITTAFYREYLRRMLERVPALIEEMKAEDNIAPDALEISSEIIYAIINENYSDEIPYYIRKLSLNDYFSEKTTGAFVIKTIQNAWRINRKQFVVDRKRQQLRYSTGDIHETNRIIKELPEDLEAHKSRDCIVMDLDVACTFFDVNFKKRFLL
ncbi:MAG: phospholipase D family protein, partial [Defluviitaleaceae bacterium]|nr:phospholipase D family protein [Defluviitaleaceae bacterium]